MCKLTTGAKVPYSLLLLVPAVLGASVARANAQDVLPSGIIESGPAESMTMVHNPANPLNLEPRVRRSHLRPTKMDYDTYLKVKAEAATAVGVRETENNQGIAALTLFFEGADRNDSADRGFIWAPPDVNTGVSTSQIVEATNNAVSVYSKSTLALLKRSPMSVFMNDPANQADPRVYFDPTWGRWVLVDIRLEKQSASQHTVNIAISKSGSATGSYWLYHVDLAFADGDFFDYPMLGMNQDAVIISGNVFGPDNFRGARVFSVAKARLYNGLGFSVPAFSGLGATLTVPVVTDQNHDAILLFDQSGTSNIGMYRLRDAAYPGSTSLSGPFNINTGSVYSIPPDADQAGTAANLDTLDTRFVNYSYQQGDFIYNAHTITSAGLPTPKGYKINHTTLTVPEQSFFFQSGSSHDWNTHLAVSPTGLVAVTWASTAPGIGQQVRINARSAANVAGIAAAGTLAVGAPSVSHYTDFRFGDYAAITPEPKKNNIFWGSNEYFKSTTTWGTRIFKVTHP